MKSLNTAFSFAPPSILSLTISVKKKNIKNSINDILIEIKDYLMGFEQYEVSIGIGMERKEFAEIRFWIKEAHRAVGDGF